MDHVAQAVDDPGAIEVDPRRGVMSQRVETGSLFPVLLGQLEGVPPHGLEQRMPRRDPFQMVLFRRLPIGREPHHEPLPLIVGQVGRIVGQLLVAIAQEAGHAVADHFLPAPLVLHHQGHSGGHGFQARAMELNVAVTL